MHADACKSVIYSSHWHADTLLCFLHSRFHLGKVSEYNGTLLLDLACLALEGREERMNQ